jgi:hypothetical protein
MRTTLLTSAALFGVVVTAPALTQPTVTPPTAPGSSVTAEPAPPNGEPVTGKLTESGVARGEGTTGGTPQEQTTSQPANNKPDEHGPAVSERIPIDTAGQPVWSKLRPHQGVQRRSPAAPRSATASVDENASADQYLRDAQTALRERRIREARQAREALGHVRYLRPDLARGGQMIDQAMSETASKGTSSPSGGQSGSTNGTNGSAGRTPPSR